MNRVYKKVAADNNLSEKTVREIYKLYWSFIREHIVKLPLKENLTEQQYSALKTNFTLPLLGKLQCTYKQWLSSRKHLEISNRERNEYKKSKAAEFSSGNNS